MKKKRKKKIIIITTVSILLAIPLIILPVFSIAVYESIFGTRYETVSWMTFSADDYEGLQVERSDFQSEDMTLAGYQYSKADQEIKGVVVIAHGLGGGGHNTYMPFVDYFTSNGYDVFAYDARGNDNSGGEVEGIPQGLIDLDNALHHVRTIEEYQDLPLTLFGHSWGGYSAGNVLNMHPEVKAAVIVAGFNESEDLIEYQGQQMLGGIVKVFLPYINLYERIKFGEEFTSVSAISGMEKTEAGIMVVHSRNDTTVPTKYGYDKFYEAFGDSDRFTFVLYEDRGHNYLFCSEAALAYMEQLNADYKSYVEDNGREYSAEVKEEFMNGYLDKKQCFEPDPILMEQILELYDTYCQKEENLLDVAIREAILTENSGKYLPGECQGTGYKIIETFEDDGVLSVYALTEYVEYGFQDGVFVNISGTNPKVLMRFKQKENGNYDLIFYTRLDLFSDLSEEEIEQLLEPLNKAGKSYVYTDEDLREIRTQADEAAIAYLKSINRVADVGVREEHKGKLLTDLVPDADFIMELIKDETYSLYPEWTGTQERIENNIRYIYQTEYDEVLQQIIFSKKQYDTNEMVERQVIDIWD